MIENFNIGLFAMALLPLLFAITVHEAAHGWAAKKLGDNTAFLLGRITLNPIKHIDLVGTIIVPIGLWIVSNGTFTFGWAKPVPFNPRNLRSFKRDIGLIAVAGPASNIVMAFLWSMIGLILISLAKADIILFAEDSIWYGILLMMRYGVVINISLAIFNMIPFPPLDGGKVAMSLLPRNLAILLSKVEPYGFYIIIAMSMTGFLSTVISPIIFFLAQTFMWYF